MGSLEQLGSSCLAAHLVIAKWWLVLKLSEGWSGLGIQDGSSDYMFDASDGVTETPGGCLGIILSFFLHVATWDSSQHGRLGVISGTLDMAAGFPQGQCPKRPKQKLQVIHSETTATFYCFDGASPNSVQERTT